MARNLYLATAVAFYLANFAAADSTGFLRFVNLENDYRIRTHTLAKGDSKYGTVSTTRFPFGNSSVYSISVSTNGYFSMGETPRFNSVLNFPISENGMIVAPYGADIDTTISGTVRYADFSQFTWPNTHTTEVTNFIRANTLDDYFLAHSMMVAEWDIVSRRNGNHYTTNRFQGILITDDSSSYAVFIYECGGMEWGGGVIGWQAGSSNYVAHDLSGKSDSNRIGCLYSNSYSAVIYRISSCDSSSEFTCSDRQCIFSSQACNDKNDCVDGSDEQGCACKSYEFTCDNGDCIYDSDACDGKEDCSDGSDEQGCVCSSYEFTCDDGQCIFDTDTCDGEKNCADGSDENDCVPLPIILGVCGGIFFLVSIAGIAVTIACIYQRRQRRLILRTAVATTEPADVASGQGSAYPLQAVPQVDTSQYQPQQAMAFHTSTIQEDYVAALPF